MFWDFFTPINKKKFQLFDYLYQHVNTTISITELTELISESNHTTHRYLNDLNELILENKMTSSSIIKRHGPEYYEFFSSDNLYHELYQALKYHLLSLSNSYQVCLLICSKRNISLIDIIDELGMSRSTAYKSINKLTSILSDVGLSLSKNDEGIYIFSGDELMIRIFQFNFFTNCYPENDWPFSFSKERIKHYIPNKLISKNDSIQLKYNFLLFNAIIFSRITQHYFLDISLEAKELYTTTLSPSIFFYFKFLDRFLRNQQIKNIEQSVYQLYVAYLFPELVPTELIKKTYCSIQQSTHIEILFLKKLMADLHTSLQLSLADEDNYFFSYHLYIHYKISLMIQKKGLSDPKVLTKFSNSGVFEDTIQSNKKESNLISLSIKKNLIAFNSNQDKQLIMFTNTINYLTQIILELYNLHKPVDFQHFYLFIDFGHNYFNKLLLKNKINNLNNPRLTIIETFENADILITDNYLINEQDKHIIYLHNIQKEEKITYCLQELYEIIMR